jgi:hypothetical protein
MARRASLPLALGVAGALAVAAPGCGGGGGGQPQHPASDGVLWLSWTVKGAAVSDTTCHAIDHLYLTMNTEAGALSIEPIPCLRGLGWEYDGLPEGNNVVILDAFDAAGNPTLEGVSSVPVTATKPAMPVPIDLEPR